MTTLRAGQDIASYCGKCKLELMHIIHALDADGKPAKVECRTCGAVHKYRVKSKKTSTTSSAKTSRAKTAKKTREEKAREAAAAKYEELLHGRTDEPAIPYAIRGTTYEVGQLVAHKKFGTGVVTDIVAADKMDVVFIHGLSTLVFGK